MSEKNQLEESGRVSFIALFKLSFLSLLVTTALGFTRVFMERKRSNVTVFKTDYCAPAQSVIFGWC